MFLSPDQLIIRLGFDLSLFIAIYVGVENMGLAKQGEEEERWRRSRVGKGENGFGYQVL